jgi:hypothetical protein
MADANAETAVRDYLKALSNPSSLRDDNTVERLRQQLESSDDGVERIRLRQQLLDAESPSVERYEEAFVSAAKAWADEHGIGVKAFQEEGVQPSVLRRAGFEVSGGGRGGRGSRGGSSGGGAAGGGRKRTRVTVAEVRAAIPNGTFTIKTLQERSGASPAVVRKVVSEEEASGGITKAGTDPDHRGPGRAPTLYRKG